MLLRRLHSCGRVLLVRGYALSRHTATTSHSSALVFVSTPADASPLLLRLLRKSCAAADKSGWVRAASSDKAPMKTGEHADAHHAPELTDPGPPFTMDEVPVPFEPYYKVRKELNSYFHKWLALGVLAFVGAGIFMYFDDTLQWSIGQPPKAYRNRVIYKPGKDEGAGTGTKDSGVPMVAGKVADAAPSTDAPPVKTPSAAAASETAAAAAAESVVPGSLPDHVPYLLVGAGTASFAAFRAIRARDADAKVLVIGEEDFYPYMHPPLSKELWFSDATDVAKTLKFKQWNGKERSVFFEEDEFYVRPDELLGAEHGGVAVARGLRVVKVDAAEHRAYLDNGAVVGFDKCLVATGGTPKSLPIFDDAPDDVKQRISLYRTIHDFQRLDDVARKAKSIAIVGGGFMGSELACALAKRGKKSGLQVTQMFPESGNMGRVLPEYLSNWTTEKIRKEGVDVKTNASVEGVSTEGRDVVLSLDTGEEVRAEHVVVAVGLAPNVDLAAASGLEVDGADGGFRADAELRVRTDVWVAGDCCSFYDIKLGRRRVEHHDHAVVSGRLAGQNMAGAGKPYSHQSMFWSDLGPDVGYEAIGLVDASLPTVAVFAKASAGDSPQAVVEASGEAMRSESEAKAPLEPPTSDAASPDVPHEGDDYGKGVVFYLQGKRVVGMVMWNVFNRMAIARKILKDGHEYDDFGEVAKLFNLHGKPTEPTSD